MGGHTADIWSRLTRTGGGEGKGEAFSAKLKTIALTKRTFVSKVMSLLFNMLSRLVRAFLPRSKHLSFMAAFTICNYFGAPKK